MRPRPIEGEPRKWVNRAILFAAEAHDGQFRKGTSMPYIFHPIAVGRILLENGCHDHVVAAGILHDVVEDTAVTPEELKQRFNEKIYKYVLAVTEPDKTLPWEARKAAYIEKAKTASLRILQVMLADKYDNLRQIRDDLHREGPEVWELFNAPPHRIKWYYGSLIGIFLQRFRREEDLSLARELKAMAAEVFRDISEVAAADGPGREPEQVKKELEPVRDGSHTDIFAEMAEGWYQKQGYITSSAKRFSDPDGEVCGGDRVIDILAVNAEETVIVKLFIKEDSIDFQDKKGKLLPAGMKRLQDHFNGAVKCLESTPEYAWMVAGGRKVRKVVCSTSFQGMDVEDSLANELAAWGMEGLTGKMVLAGTLFKNIDIFKKKKKGDNI